MDGEAVSSAVYQGSTPKPSLTDEKLEVSQQGTPPPLYPVVIFVNVAFK